MTVPSLSLTVTSVHPVAMGRARATPRRFVKVATIGDSHMVRASEWFGPNRIPGVRVKNFGVGGAKLSTYLDDVVIPKVLRKYKPDIIFIWIGSNNVQEGYDRFQVLRMFRRYYDLCKRENIQCFTLALPNRYTGYEDYNRESKAINRTLRRWQKDHFIQLPEFVYERWGYKRDGVHLRYYLYDHISMLIKEIIGSLF